MWLQARSFPRVRMDKRGIATLLLVIMALLLAACAARHMDVRARGEVGVGMGVAGTL